MSKLYFCIVFLMVGIIASLFLLSGQEVETKYTNADFLRIHIRANSNETKDQNVKYMVKNKIVETMNEFLAEIKTKQDAINCINDNISLIEQAANNVLKSNGFNYTASAQIKSENFPTRAYDDLVLDAGVYDALIINLGSGKGDNWWCVVYPPLCFVNANSSAGENIVYKSKLLEIIKNFFNGN